MTVPRDDDDAPVIAPPATLTVYDDGPRTVLWVDEGHALVRPNPIGFTALPWSAEGDCHG